MCEDCPIYEGYPTSVLGWDKEGEEDTEGQACCDCQNGVVVVERYAQLPTGDLFVMTACGCECHDGDESEED